MFVFFFQAEDGIRDIGVTGVQTCALPIFPEESFERIREARDLHKEGLGTESVRRQLREGGGPHTGELKKQLHELSENLERLRGNERPPADEAPPSHALRTILARQNLLISAMFNLTEMVEELLLASGKPRDRKSTRLNSSHANISYAVFCLKKKKRISSPRHAAPA